MGSGCTTLAVKKEAVAVYYNAKMVCNKTSGGPLGSTIIPDEADRHFWASDPLAFSANTRLFKIMYYPGMDPDIITQDMLGAMMDVTVPTGAQRYDGEVVVDDPFAHITSTVDYPLGHLIPGGLRPR